MFANVEMGFYSSVRMKKEPHPLTTDQIWCDRNIMGDESIISDPSILGVGVAFIGKCGKIAPGILNRPLKKRTLKVYIVCVFTPHANRIDQTGPCIMCSPAPAFFPHTRKCVNDKETYTQSRSKWQSFSLPSEQFDESLKFIVVLLPHRV